MQIHPEINNLRGNTITEKSFWKMLFIPYNDQFGLIVTQATWISTNHLSEDRKLKRIREGK